MWLAAQVYCNDYPDLVHRVRIGSSTFTATQESAGDGQTEGVSETECICTTCINEVRFYEHVEARINSFTFPLSCNPFYIDFSSTYTTSKFVLKASSHAARIALDLGAPSLRTHEAAKEDEVHR